MKILLLIGSFFATVFHHAPVPSVPVVQTQKQNIIQTSTETPAVKPEPIKITKPSVVKTTVAPVSAVHSPVPQPVPQAPVPLPVPLTPAEQYVQNVVTEYANGQIGTTGPSNQTVQPAPIFQPAPTPTISTINTRISNLEQQILDIKTKYYSDLDALQHQPELESAIEGEEQNLLNTANEKIEKINLQIEQLQLGN